MLSLSNLASFCSETVQDPSIFGLVLRSNVPSLLRLGGSGWNPRSCLINHQTHHPGISLIRVARCRERRSVKGDRSAVRGTAAVNGSRWTKQSSTLPAQSSNIFKPIRLSEPSPSPRRFSLVRKYLKVFAL